MKTIEVSDEVYNNLVGIATEMTTQDPRGTRMPHIFQIRDWKKVYDWNLNGDIKVWIDDYVVIETFEDFKEYLGDRSIDIPDDILTIWEGSIWDMEEFLEENDIQLKACTYSLEPVYINAFLTEKAAQEHLNANRHHYHHDADVYLTHGWRNVEMEILSTFLCGLVGEKMYT